MPPAIGVIVPFTLPPGSIIAENNPVARNANKRIADKEDRWYSSCDFHKYDIKSSPTCTIEDSYPQIKNKKGTFYAIRNDILPVETRDDIQTKIFLYA